MDLKKCLEEFERVEADKGYVGECPAKARTPHPLYTHDKEVIRMKNNVAGRHETVNGRVKNFATMIGLFRNSVHMHSSCFRSVVIIVQLSIENGDNLFDTKYNNY